MPGRRTRASPRTSSTSRSASQGSCPSSCQLSTTLSRQAKICSGSRRTPSMPGVIGAAAASRTQAGEGLELAFEELAQLFLSRAHVREDVSLLQELEVAARDRGGEGVASERVPVVERLGAEVGAEEGAGDPSARDGGGH